MDEVTLRDYLKVLFRQKWVVITSIVTVTAVVALGLWIKTNTYEATVKMLVTAQKGVEAPYYGPLVNMQNVQVAFTQSEIVKSTPVMERALKAIGLKPLDFEKKFASPLRVIMIDREVASINEQISKMALKLDDAKLAEQQKQNILFRMALKGLEDNVKVEPIRDTNLFVISYRDFDPGVAAAIANIISRSYVIFDLEQQLAEMQMKYGDKNLAVIQLRDSIMQMEKNLNGQILPNIEAIGPASVKIVNQALPPMRPTGMPNMMTLILAFFMSIFLGIMLAFGFDYMDQTFKSPQELETVLGVPYLGSVPKRARPEAYHKIAEQVYFEMKDKKVKVLLVASAMPKEGVSTVTAYLARLIASKPGCKVLAIDTNLRKPALHHLLKVANSAGLVDVLEDKLSFDKAVIHVSDKVSVLTAGNADLNPVTLLESHKMAELLKNVSEKYDVILIDGANLRETKDALNLVPLTQGTLIVVDEGKTRRHVVKYEFESILEKKAVIGAILNNRTFAIPKAIYERI